MYAYLSPSILSPGQKADRFIQSTHHYGISCSVVFLEIWSWRGKMEKLLYFILSWRDTT